MLELGGVGGKEELLGGFPAEYALRGSELASEAFCGVGWCGWACWCVGGC